MHALEIVSVTFAGMQRPYLLLDLRNELGALHLDLEVLCVYLRLHICYSVSATFFQLPLLYGTTVARDLETQWEEVLLEKWTLKRGRAISENRALILQGGK